MKVCAQHGLNAIKDLSGTFYADAPFFLWSTSNYPDAPLHLFGGILFVNEVGNKGELTSKRPK